MVLLAGWWYVGFGGLRFVGGCGDLSLDFRFVGMVALD